MMISSIRSFRSWLFPAIERHKDLADQVILLSGTGDVSGLGEYPKLFVASEGEGLADTVRRMAEEAPGDRNEVLILPGDAHAQAIFETNQGGEAHAGNTQTAERERIVTSETRRGAAGGEKWNDPTNTPR